MYSLTYYLLCCIFLTHSIIYTADLFAGDVIDLGSYKTSVAIGKDPIPRRYQPLTELDKKAILNVHFLINKFRSNFSTGVPPLPALDPYVGQNFQAIDVHAQNLPFSGTVIIKRIRLTGVKRFCLHNIEIRMNSLRTDFHITVPELNANDLSCGSLFNVMSISKVTFDVTVKLGGIVPISAKGKVRIAVTGMSLLGFVWAAEKQQSRKNVYSIEGLRVGFYANDIKIQLLKTNLKNYQLKLISSSSSSFSKTELTSMINAIKNDVALEVIQQINDILKKITVEKVKNYLLAE